MAKYLLTVCSRISEACSFLLNGLPTNNQHELPIGPVAQLDLRSMPLNSDAVEQHLQEIWQRVLHLEKISAQEEDREAIPEVVSYLKAISLLTKLMAKCQLDEAARSRFSVVTGILTEDYIARLEMYEKQKRLKRALHTVVFNN